jgi:hypothetical protein
MSDGEREAALEMLRRSRALWNRSTLDLASDETLAQVMDRGEVEAWRALYRLAREDAALRARMKRIVHEVPLGLPRFWLAALKGLDPGRGDDVDLGMNVPADDVTV